VTAEVVVPTAPETTFVVSLAAAASGGAAAS
jgi:hypothetical protein